MKYLITHQFDYLDIHNSFQRYTYSIIHLDFFSTAAQKEGEGVEGEGEGEGVRV